MSQAPGGTRSNEQHGKAKRREDDPDKLAEFRPAGADVGVRGTPGQQDRGGEDKPESTVARKEQATAKCNCQNQRRRSTSWRVASQRRC